jgi:hypothetical protein
MKTSISSEHGTLLADLDRLIENAIEMNMLESAMTLRMAKLDLHTRIYGISDHELRELSGAVERVLFQQPCATRTGKSACPRRPAPRAFKSRSVAKN